MKNASSSMEINPKQKKKTIYAWLVGMIVLVLVMLYFTNPFAREQGQVQQLRTIGQEEQQNNKAADDVNSYISNERVLKDVDQSLKDFGEPTNATP